MNKAYYCLTFILVASAIITEVISHPHKFTIPETERICASHYGINITLSEYIINGTKNIKEAMGKEILPCAIGCYMKGYGIITPAGYFDAKTFLFLLPHMSKDLHLDVATENDVKKCDDIKGHCICDTTQNIIKCMPPVLREYFQKKQWL
ncbi:uncharacterized protein LOC103568228 [Microplitis demolitor]|uniref:uncharacterized protein LOC103568228 n=1 Tax=Microplitis demolitor TaxID=69319 RepID=UPI0004CD8C22|nr:uncharacterized protein LOC103568228 [Microplitis demolitor]